jgi:HEAT repeat protein
MYRGWILMWIVGVVLLAGRLAAQPETRPLDLDAETDVPKLVQMLGHGSTEQRVAVLWRLAQLRDTRAVEPLLDLLREKQAPIRGAAAMALGRIAGGYPRRTLDPRLLPALLSLLDDKDIGAARQALYALRDLADPAVVEPILCLAGNPKCPVRLQALQVLSAFHDARALPVFIRALGDADKYIRAAAIQGLQDLPGEQAMLALTNRLQDVATDADVVLLTEQLTVYSDFYTAKGGSDAVAIAIALIQRKTADLTLPGTMLCAAKSTPARAIGILLLGWKRDLRATGPAVTLLRDPEETVRWVAARTLAHLGDLRALAPAQAALADPSPRVRAAAAQVLGAIGDRRAADALAALQQDKDTGVREATVQALATLGDTRVLDQVFALCTAADPRQRARAVALLARLPDPRTFDALERALADPVNVVRVQAIKALGWLDDPRALVLLLRATRDVLPGKPLGELFPPAPDEVLDSHGMPIDPRVQAVMVLGQRHDPRALDTLLGLMREINSVRDYQWVVPPAVARYQDPRATTALIVDAKRGSWCSIEALCTRGPEGIAALREMILDPKYPMPQSIMTITSQAFPDDASYARLLDDPRMLDTLHRQLNHGEMDIRMSAITLLGKAKDLRSVPPLLAVAQKGLQHDSAQAIGTLVAIRQAHPEDKSIDGMLLPVLTELTGSNMPEIALRSRVALVECGHAEALPPLLELARTSTDPQERREALWNLARVDDPRVVDTFRAAFRDPHVQVRRDALFGAMSGPVSASLRQDALRGLWDEDSDVREYAATFLADDPASIMLLCSRLLNADDRQRQSLVMTVSRWRVPGAVPLLIGILRDPTQSWPMQPDAPAGFATCPRI